MQTDPKSVLQHMRDKCEALWRNESIEVNFGVVELSLREALPQLKPEEIRAAGKANPPYKAVSYDGFHPRHFAHLDDEGCRVFALLWQASELLGVLPAAVEESLAPLIPELEYLRGHVPEGSECLEPRASEGA